MKKFIALAFTSFLVLGASLPVYAEESQTEEASEELVEESAQGEDTAEELALEDGLYLTDANFMIKGLVIDGDQIHVLMRTEEADDETKGSHLIGTFASLAAEFEGEDVENLEGASVSYTEIEEGSDDPLAEYTEAYYTIRKPEMSETDGRFFIDVKGRELLVLKPEGDQLTDYFNNEYSRAGDVPGQEASQDSESEETSNE